MLQEEQRQREPRPLATGQGFDRFINVVSAKKKSAEIVAGSFLARCFGAQHRRKRRAASRELLMSLGVVPGFDIRAELIPSLQRRQTTRKRTTQSRFPGAIWSDQADPLAALNG